jgi:hypothetical protein
MGDAAFLFILLLFIGGIFIMRLVGAWMLRINDVIKELQQIKAILMDNQRIAQQEKIGVKPPDIKPSDYV